VGASPVVSVILAVRNGINYLPAAIESILNQSFSDLELIAIDDGSTDGTAAFLDGLSDARVRIYHQEGVGLAASLNRGISLARGRFIERQDHDDLAMPSRIEKQVEFLESHADYALVGTRSEIWIGDHRTGRYHDHPTDDVALRFELLFNNPFVHSSVMIRKSALDQVGFYTTDPGRQPPEDYELWSRIARRYRVANLPERLTIYREVPGSVSRTGASPFREKLVLLTAENLAWAAGRSQPARIHFQIAELVHGVPGVVMSRSDTDRMCQILDQAARSIADDQYSPDVRARVERWQRELRHQSWMRRRRFKLLWLVAGRFRNALIRLGLLQRK
jgi:glycosyltransferase involved in cell wall biosynthesis